MISWNQFSTVLHQDKLYQELGLESLQHRCLCSRLCLFHNILKAPNPEHIFNLMPARHSSYTTRNVSTYTFFNAKHSFLKKLLYPINYHQMEYIKLCNLRSMFIFKKHILQFIQPSSNFVYNSHDLKIIKLMTRD